MKSEYRRLAIIQLLEKSSVHGVSEQIIMLELERIFVDGTEQQIRDDLSYLVKADAIGVDVAHDDGHELRAYRLKTLGEEHLKRLRTITGVTRAPLRRS